MHRGLRTVGHSGSDAGFRSQVLWFPEPRLGVVCLSNLSSGEPGRRALAIAEAMLGDSAFPEPPPTDPPPPPTVPLKPSLAVYGCVRI